MLNLALEFPSGSNEEDRLVRRMMNARYGGSMDQDSIGLRRLNIGNLDHALRTAGFIIRKDIWGGSFSDIDSLTMGFAKSDLIRMSLNPQIEPDIDGFLSILEEEMMKLKAHQ